MSTCEVNTIKERTTKYIEIKSSVYLIFEIVVLFSSAFFVSFSKTISCSLKNAGTLQINGKRRFTVKNEPLKNTKQRFIKC